MGRVRSGTIALVVRLNLWRVQQVLSVDFLEQPLWLPHVSHAWSGTIARQLLPASRVKYHVLKVTTALPVHRRRLHALKVLTRRNVSRSRGLFAVLALAAISVLQVRSNMHRTRVHKVITARPEHHLVSTILALQALMVKIFVCTTARSVWPALLDTTVQRLD